MSALMAVAALLTGVAILLTGNGLQGILLPVRASLEGFSTVSIGLIGSGYFAGFAAGCWLGPHLVKNVGHIRAFTTMTAVAAAVILMHGFILVPGMWLVLRALSGFCFAVLYMVIESWLNDCSTKENRGTVLSAYMIINLTVLTVGQMLVTTYDPQRLELFGVVAMLISLAAVPVALTRAQTPAPIQSTRVRFGHLYGISPVGVVGCIAVGMANGAFWTLSPAYAEANGLQGGGTALFMSATVLGGALSQWPLGWLSDRGDRRRVLLLSAAIGAVIALTLVKPLLQPGYGLLLLAALWGAAAFPAYTLAVAHANDAAAPEEFVEVSSGLLFAYGAGAVVGPMIASAMMTALGPSYLYAFCAAVHVLLVLFIGLRLLQKRPVPMDEHVSFRESQQAALTVGVAFDQETQTHLEEQAESQPQAEQESKGSG